MPAVTKLRVHSKTYNTPKKPYVGTRIKSELEQVGKYGLRCKREIYRAKFMLRKIRKTARTLLTLEEHDQKRQFEGKALLRRLHILGILESEKNELDYVLALKVEDLLNRRLQSVVTEKNIKSHHEARVLIRKGFIRIGQQLVTCPSFLVRKSTEKHIKKVEAKKAGRAARKHNKAE